MAIDQGTLDKIFKAALKEADTPIKSSHRSRQVRRVVPTTMETTAALNTVLSTPPPPANNDRRP